MKAVTSYSTHSFQENYFRVCVWYSMVVVKLQKSWSLDRQHLFHLLARDRAGRGIILATNAFTSWTMYETIGTIPPSHGKSQDANYSYDSTQRRKSLL